MSAGACFLAACDAGFEDCDHLQTDGCESNQNTDINNCGACGHACNVAGGETCVAGSCTCASGADCNGVCTPTTDDPNNCGGCGITCGMPTSAALDSGLIGHWKLDEGAGTTSTDSSGNGHTATLSGATWTTGYSGGAVAGNGSSSYVSASLGTTFGSNSPLTASAWVYATSTTNGPVFGVTSIPSGGTWNMPFLSIAGPIAYGWLWGVPGIDYTASPLAATVSLNAWHFLAITYVPSGSSGSEKFYVDGALAGTATGAYQPSGDVDTWSTYIRDAKPTAVTNAYLNGKIDEVRAYSRALSAAEITILYNAARPARPRPAAAAPAASHSAAATAPTRPSTPATAAPAAPPATRLAARAASPATAAAPAAPTAAPSASTRRPIPTTAAAVAPPAPRSPALRATAE